MKKINDDKKLKVLYYYDLGIPPPVIAIALKISETSVKNILKENNRSGPPPTFAQAYNTWLYLNQQSGEPVLIDSFKDNQLREQKLKEENNAQEIRITQLTDDLQKATDREQNQKQELEKKNKELEQKDLKIEDLELRKSQITKKKETEKLEKEKLQDKKNELYELLIKKERELGEEKTKVIKLELENKAMQKEYHDKLEKINDGVTNLITALGHSEKMKNTLTEENTQLKRENQRLKEKEKNSWETGFIVGGLVGAGLGIIGVLCYQKFFDTTQIHPYP